VADILQVFQKNELACIFGAFTAEGSSIRSNYQYFDKARTRKRISHQYKIEFDIGDRETDFRDFIVNTLSRIYPGTHFYERKKKGERRISISQKAIVNDFLSKYNSFIANHNLTPDDKASFLRGFFEGDGGVNIRRNTIQCNQSSVNTAKLEIVCKYLRELNIKNRVATYKYTYSTNPTHFLELSGLEAHVRYYTQVGFISKNKEEKLRQIMLTRIRKAKHYNNPRFGAYIKARKNNALSFLREARVINKEILDYDDCVYDITLEWEEFPYYFANGILTHNSLYPMLMMKKNLSGETVKCKCCPDSPNRVPELDYHICQRPGIVPRSLKILLERRMAYKKLKKTALDNFTRQKYDERQSALKWILVCSFGYLGFKNARFGKIDAHIATCAFSRVVIKKAIAMAEDHGFRMVHAIVDSMWLKKPGATTSDYEKLSAMISNELDLPLGFEGEYKWIVFLNSKINPRIPVLNRYYGVFQDGTIKIRGIDLRRHDTPEIVRQCQSSMLEVLSKAENSEQFIQLIPTTLGVLKSYVSKIRDGKVRLEELIITKGLSKNPGEYTHHVPQAVAAKLLVKEGGTVHAGQQVDYILTHDRLDISENRAVPWELVDENTVYDPDEYVKLLLSSAANLLLPFGYDLKTLQKQVG
jgi:DNA polymerase elongation subunit (family B)